MTKDIAPVNILKTGEDPALKPDEDYPAWLWKLASPPTSLGDLSRKYDADGAKSLSFEEVKNELLQMPKSMACVAECMKGFLAPFVGLPISWTREEGRDI